MTINPKVKDGEWVTIIKSGYYMGCCDCGLVHKLQFRIHEGKIYMRAYRDPKGTEELRDYMSAVKRLKEKNPRVPYKKLRKHMKVNL